MMYNLNDINKVNKSTLVSTDYDVCIIGAGPAGITLALNLSSSLKVLLLEAGDYDYTQQSQDCYVGENLGHEYYKLDECRMRFLGGSSNIWGGYCVPLQEIDFNYRKNVNLSQWPINKKDLDPYSSAAKKMFTIPEDTDLSSTELFKKNGKLKQWDGKWKQADKSFHEIGVYQLPVSKSNFRDNYYEELKSKNNIYCCLNANLTDISLEKNLKSVNEIEVKNYNQDVYTFKSKKFVLATGAIENARILLQCNKQMKNGIGNYYGHVGRYFADNPHYKVASFILEDEIKQEVYKSGKDLNDIFLIPSMDYINEKNSNNLLIRMQPNEVLETNFVSPSFRKNIKKVICKSDLLTEVVNSFRSRRVLCLTLPKNDGITMDGKIGIASAVVPNPNSKITLSDNKTDMFGLKRPQLTWSLLRQDKVSYKKASLEIAKLFAQKNLGRVKIEDWVLDDRVGFPGFPYTIAGLHHMCTTRMGFSKEDGVVDRNLKVFGIDNFYIAGSSVFSSTGYANPTFTIVQLSLRLADHINRSFKTNF